MKKVKFLAKNTCYISKDSTIGENCVIYPSVVIENSKIGNNVIIQTGTIIKDNSIIGDNCFIGPSVLIRNNTEIGNESVIGHGTELKNIKCGEKCNFAHKNFLGDAILGKNVSFGFCSCIANFDFKKINQTIIEDNVKVGCGSILVAPLKIESNSIIAAGCKITKDVKKNSFVKPKNSFIIENIK